MRTRRRGQRRVVRVGCGYCCYLAAGSVRCCLFESIFFHAHWALQKKNPAPPAPLSDPKGVSGRCHWEYPEISRHRRYLPASKCGEPRQSCAKSQCDSPPRFPEKWVLFGTSKLEVQIPEVKQDVVTIWMASALHGAAHQNCRGVHIFPDGLYVLEQRKFPCVFVNFHFFSDFCTVGKPPLTTRLEAASRKWRSRTDAWSRTRRVCLFTYFWMQCGMCNDRFVRVHFLAREHPARIAQHMLGTRIISLFFNNFMRWPMRRKAGLPSPPQSPISATEKSGVLHWHIRQ